MKDHLYIKTNKFVCRNYLSCKCQPERLVTSLKADLHISTFSMFSLKHSSYLSKACPKVPVCLRTSDGSTS